MNVSQLELMSGPALETDRDLRGFQLNILDGRGGSDEEEGRRGQAETGREKGNLPSLVIPESRSVQ